jgi:hypothetical protein
MTVIIALVTGVLLSLMIQTSRVYTRTSAHVEPQASLMLALKRMEREIRDGMFFVLNSTDSTVEIVLPLRETNGMNVITGTSLQEGNHVCFFLGKKVGGETAWSAVPDPLGDTIFRIEGAGFLQPLSSSYTNTQAKIIIEGVASTPMVPDPTDPTREIATTVFTYAPLDEEGFLMDETRLIRITLTVPLKEHTPSGIRTVNHTMQTSFSLRNLDIQRVEG